MINHSKTKFDRNKDRSNKFLKTSFFFFAIFVLSSTGYGPRPPVFCLEQPIYFSSGLDFDSTTLVITQQCILEEADSTEPIFGAFLW